MLTISYSLTKDGVPPQKINDGKIVLFSPKQNFAFINPFQTQKILMGINFFIPDGYCLQIVPSPKLFEKGIILINGYVNIFKGENSELILNLLNVNFKSVDISSISPVAYAVPGKIENSILIEGE